MKRILKFFSILMFLFLLTGCENVGRKVTRGIVNANIDEVDDYREEKTKKVKEVFSKESVVLNESTLLFTIKNNDGGMGVYSGLEDKMLVDYNNSISNVLYIENDYFPSYFEVAYNDGEMALYDYLGNKLLDKKAYTSMFVTLTKNGKAYEETISYSTSEGSTIDNFTFKKMEKRKGVKSEFEYGKKLDNDISGIDLTEYGLKDYKMVNGGSIIIVYNKNNKIVAKVNVDNNFTALGIINGYLIMQRTVQVDENAKKFNYIDNSGNKINIITKAINLRNGNTKNLNVDYVITSLECIKNTAGNWKLGYATIRRVQNNALSSYNEDYIINSNCKIKYNFSNGIDIGDIVRIDRNHYYDTANNILYKNNFKVVLDIGNNTNLTFVGINRDEKLVYVRHSNKVGAINLKGKVVVPFKYDSIDKNSIDGKLYVTVGGNAGFYDLKKKKENSYNTIVDLKNINGLFTYVSSAGQAKIYAGNQEIASYTDATLATPVVSNEYEYGKFIYYGLIVNTSNGERIVIVKLK